MNDRTVTLLMPEALMERIAEHAAVLVRDGSLSRDPSTDTTRGGREASPYLNVKEAASYLRAKPQRIYDLLSSGRLTRYKDGRRVLVLRGELDALLNDPNRVAPTLPRASLTRMDRRSTA